MKGKILIFILVALMLTRMALAAHFIVGIVNNARDGTLANGHTVVLWNPANGIEDNLTDIIGPSGNSGADNIYMLDCEMLQTECGIGNEIRVRVINNGDDYITSFVNSSVTGAGYDLMENLILNSPPNITSVVVDDSIVIPENEIDLIAASNRKVTCEAIVSDLDTQLFQNATAEFFDSAISYYNDLDDNNKHYTNDSCYINESYGGENEARVICDFQIGYYANSEEWKCVLRVEDNLSISNNNSDLTFINSLLSIGAVSIIDLGVVSGGVVSDELEINITNFGNIMINLSLSGYAVSEGDNLSMNCTLGSLKNISINYEKYNLTASNPGALTLSQFEAVYINLTSSPVVKRFGLNYRQNDAENEALNSTYWRIYVPVGVAGSCSGNIVFGASQAAGI